MTTTRMRIVLESGEASVGLREWKAYAVPPAKTRPIHISRRWWVSNPSYRRRTKVYADGVRLDAPVSWQPVEPEQLDEPGSSFELIGLVEGTGLTATATVYVRETNEVSITHLAPEEIVTLVGVRPELPPTVTATFNDGSKDNVNTIVTWEDIAPAQYSKPSTFTVTGSVEDTTLTAKAEVTVLREAPESD